MGPIKSLVLIVLLVAGVASALQAGGGTKDDEKVLGTWMMVSGERGGKKQAIDAMLRFTFSKDGKFTLTQKGPDAKMTGTYKLNAKKTPREIDLTVVKAFGAGGAAVDGGGKKFLGIFVFEKDNLKLCLGEIEKERPTTFEAPKGTGTMLTILKLEKNPSRLK
jgi:uncharacterized protein (TIGR03067 family)